MTHTDHRGFLFMEGSLMVLIAGVGILSAALFPSMTAYLERSRQMSGSLETQVSPSAPSAIESDYIMRGRDTTRISHLRELATGISNYYTDTTKLPPVPISGCISSQVLDSMYIPKFPRDPIGRATKGCDGSDGTYTYRILDVHGMAGFVLQAEMESARGGNSDIDLDTILAGSDPAGVIDGLQRGSGKYYIQRY